MADFVVVIPARYASVRLPGKALRDIRGKPMIQHVYERGMESGAADVVIATDDERIADVAEAFGAVVCMTLHCCAMQRPTSPHWRHLSGTRTISRTRIV